MKIGIVIPLKAKSVSKNWDITTANLNATIKSVIGQTSKHFQCVVVGHDRPAFMDEIEKSYPNCTFQNYQRFEPPTPGPEEAENQLKYEFDRCNKILEGIIYLRNKTSDITHWFALDADDLINKEFVQSLKQYETADAIILESGYSYFKNTGILNKENEFSAYCGSSAVISNRLIEIPEEINETSFRRIPFGNISHVNMGSTLRKKGYDVRTCTDRIVMYVRDNGENISNLAYYDTFYKRLKKYIKMLLKIRFFTKSTRQDFGL